MDIRASNTQKCKCKCKCKCKWLSASFLALANVALFITICLLAIPLATLIHTQDANSLRRRTTHAQNLQSHLIRRRLSFGPGSYPPRCMYKCGRCAPCYPVHVPVPPGTLFFPTEYYPEAWRCKCGNRLYMP